MLAKYHPIWMNLHFNHSNEVTPEVARAVDKLTRAGIPIGNQSVLLAGVNDCVNIQRDLVHRLVEMRVRPYYLYQCDLVEGSGHFRTPVGKGLEIIEGLRGHTSGYAVPTYVIDAPGGGGKIPVMPNYLISYSDHKVVLRNYEGYITTYEEPLHYEQHDKASCKACQSARPEPGQSGVYGLLAGRADVDRADGLRAGPRARQSSSRTGCSNRTSGRRTASARSRARHARRCPSYRARPATATAARRLRTRRGAAAARGRADRLRSRRAALAARTVLVRQSTEHGMAVRHYGDGEKVIVYLHGLGEAGGIFDAACSQPSLRRPAYTHVVPDLPGYGRSSWPAVPVGLGELAEQLAAWLSGFS